MSGLFAAGLILLALAAVADFVGRRSLRSWPPYLLGAAGSACLAVLGGFALAGRCPARCRGLARGSGARPAGGRAGG